LIFLLDLSRAFVLIELVGGGPDVDFLNAAEELLGQGHVKGLLALIFLQEGGPSFAKRSCKMV
jgi:hypothetical protein